MRLINEFIERLVVEDNFNVVIDELDIEGIGADRVGRYRESWALCDRRSLVRGWVAEWIRVYGNELSGERMKVHNGTGEALAVFGNHQIEGFTEGRYFVKTENGLTVMPVAIYPADREYTISKRQIVEFSFNPDIPVVRLDCAMAFNTEWTDLIVDSKTAILLYSAVFNWYNSNKRNQTEDQAIPDKFLEKAPRIYVPGHPVYHESDTENLRQVGYLGLIRIL